MNKDMPFRNSFWGCCLGGWIDIILGNNFTASVASCNEEVQVTYVEGIVYFRICLIILMNNVTVHQVIALKYTDRTLINRSREAQSV
jgi:hypothetical protein